MMVAHGKAFCIISRKISSQFSEHIGTCLYFSHHTSMIRVSFGKLTCLTPDNCKSSFIGVWSVEDSQMCIKWTSSPEKKVKKNYICSGKKIRFDQIRAHVGVIFRRITVLFSRRLNIVGGVWYL